MATVQFIACRPPSSPDEASVVAARRDRDRDAVPIFSAAQPRPAAASATAFAESKAALRRRARVRRQALMVVAGRLPGEQRPAGVHPAGHRSLLVVVVVVPLIATARGSVGQRRGEERFRGQHVRTRLRTGRPPVRILFAYGSVAGPRC